MLYLLFHEYDATFWDCHQSDAVEFQNNHSMLLGSKRDTLAWFIHIIICQMQDVERGNVRWQVIP